MARLKWWLRIVGAFYVLNAVTMAVVRAPIRAFGPPGTLARESAGDPTARFLVDAWVTFGLEVAAIGVALMIASRIPDQARVLVWTIIGIEIARGIVADTYMISRGINATGLLIWIIIHTVIIVTGLLVLRVPRPDESVASRL